MSFHAITHLKNSEAIVLESASTKTTLTFEETQNLIRDLQSVLELATTKKDLHGNTLKLARFKEDYVPYQKGDTFWVLPTPLSFLCQQIDQFSMYPCFDLDIFMVPGNVFEYVN